MTRSRRTMRRSPEGDDEEFILFLHEIPPSTRWQELKDLAKEYGTTQYKAADTISPKHETGYMFFTGRRNAQNAYEQFSHHGWRGRSIVVTLNGPVDRERVRQGCSESFMRLVIGPVRSPGASQQGRKIDLQRVNSAMASFMQQGPDVPRLTATSHVSVNIPSYITAAPAPYYNQPTSRADVPIPYDRHAFVPVSHVQTQTSPQSPIHDTLPPSPYYHSRHSVPAPSFTDHAIPHPRPLRSHPPAAANPHQPHTMAITAPRSISVRGLPPDFSAAKAINMFERIGPVEPSSVRVQPQRERGSRNNTVTAYATFQERRATERAVAELNGRNTRDGVLSVCFQEDPEGGIPRGANSSGGGRARRQTASNTRPRPAQGEPQRDTSRQVERWVAERREDPGRRPPQRTTRGPLVVDGARGSVRRRRDVRSENERRASQSHSDSDSDSDASDVRREARRRGSSGSGTGSGGSSEEF